MSRLLEDVHDPASCELLGCRRCDDYFDGYSAGKDKAHFEVRVRRPGEHFAGCGCEVCQTAAAVLNAEDRAAEEAP